MSLPYFNTTKVNINIEIPNKKSIYCKIILMKVIKLTESELNRIIKRVLQTEQESENNEETNLVVGLRNFAKGKISENDLYALDNEIYNIYEKNPLGQSILTIKFDDEKQFLEDIGLDEQDVWFMQAVTGYQGYEFMDSYQIEQDFKDGYNVYYELNDENKETLKNIAQIILPGQEFDIENEEYRSELSRTLIDLFPTEIGWILGDYESEKENEMNSVAKESIKQDFNEPLGQNGITFNYDMDEVSISVADLYMNALQLGLWSYTSKEMIVEIIKKIVGDSIGGWYENSYVFQNEDYFDLKSFNREVNRQFEKIIEKLEENSDDTYTIKDYIEFRDRLTSKYKLKNWYTVPKDNNIMFFIESINFPNMTIKFRIKDKTLGLYKTFELDEEQFNNFLYQYSLEGLENS
jgi:frataxin-like iron-binding protein CyaY